MENHDGQIKAVIIRQLACDPRIDTSKIYVRVRDGVVVLSGSVSTYPIQLAMHKSVWIIPGVKAIKDYTIVGNGKNNAKIPDDAALQRHIQSTLSRRNIFGFEKVKVEVHGGWVVLSGWVTSYWQKSWLEIFSSEVAGVRGVINLLSIKISKSVPDKEILEIIMPMVQGYQRLDEAASFDVQVNRGTVQISGVIGCLSVYQKIRKAIFLAPGVIGFDEHVRVVE
ncbi:MAG: BON domain-containing protein [Patescibacteria group bacterium]|nr:BON domain-containing protein [Patescibacteria group bacterium]